jgi:hypothetical protein
MRKLSKVIGTAVLVIVIVVVVVVIAVGLFANTALKAAIESAGTSALNVKVMLDGADLSVMSGKLGLRNLVINNPPGYEHPRLLELQDAKIAVQLKSLLGNAIKIKDIKLDGVKLVLEQKGLSNNLHDIIKMMPSQEKTAEQAEPSGRKLHIDNLEITNVTAMVKLLPVPGKEDTITLTLSPIKMTDLGSDNKLDLAALSGKIIMAIAGGVAQQGAGILPDDMIKTINSGLSKAIDLSKGIFGEGKDAGEKALKGTENIGKGIGEGLKGLLKKKEQE